MRRGLVIATVLLGLGWVPAGLAPAPAAATTCTSAISGPNDPDFAPAERQPVTGGTFNSEQWPLFDCMPQSTPLATDPEGAAGMSVNRAWAAFGRGNPQVLVAYMEGGVNWRLSQSADLRDQAYLNTGELPYPEDASGHDHGTYDLNGDGIVSVEDYANDPRIARPFLHPQAGGITAEDLIAAFGHCRIVDHELQSCPPGGAFDNDGNGYPNDISGWNFHRDTDDPQTDNSIYAHSDAESRAMAAQADNGILGAGVCPGCRLLEVKMGDEAIDRPDRVAEAILFAVDSGAKVIDCTTAALGQTPSMRAAVEYAYRHGVTIAWASNDFESSDHTEGMRFPHVWPGNSIVSDQSVRGGIGSGSESSPKDALATTFRSRSSLTSYGAHALFSVPTADGSTSTAIPTTAGVAALVTSAGIDAFGAHQISAPLSANEVFQVTRATASPIDQTPCPTCFPAVGGAEWNIQYGYGRPNLFAAMQAVHQGNVPPEASIDAPDWYAEVDPTHQRTVAVSADVAARRSTGYHWELQYATGVEPLDSQWHTFAGGSGSSAQTVRGALDLSQIPSSFWSGAYQAPTADRLSIERYDVSLRVRVTDAQGRLGEDRRVFYLRHDPSEIWALHKNLGTSIESSPTLADIEGKGWLDTIVAGSDGTVYAFRPDGRLAPGWPVHTALARGVDPKYPYNYLRAPSWRSGQIPRPHEPIDAPLAVGDLFHTGALDVVVTGEDGHVYAWDGRGRMLKGFPVATDRRYARQSVPVPDTPYTRNASTGAVAGAALADLQGNGRLDIVMGAWDGHVYAWQPNGKLVPGWPVATDTPDSARHPPGTDVYARDYKVATTPTIVDVDGDGHPDVVVALQDTAFGSSGSPVYGYVVAYSSRGNLRPGGALLPHFPITLPAAAQGYGSAQDFITEGVQTPAAYGGGSSTPTLVANPGLFLAQTIDLTSGNEHPETPGTLPAESAVNPASPLVHFTTSASLGRLGSSGALTAVQAGSAVTDVATGIVATPGLGIRVRSGIEAWDPATGANLPQYTQELQGLPFLTAPALADVSGDGRPDIVIPTDSEAMFAFDGQTGQPVAGWPKWTGGWGAFTPAVGDLTGNGRVEVVEGTREGYLHAWSTPGLASGDDQAWHWHQNDRDTGHYGDDTRPPAAVRALHVRRVGRNDVLTFRSPGDDWNFGTPASYEVFRSGHAIGQNTLGQARRVPTAQLSAVRPRVAGTTITITVPHVARMPFYAVRAVDKAGNIGPLPYVATPRRHRARHHRAAHRRRPARFTG